METKTMDLESASLPSIYQCIVCQMTTDSLSKLHRHQTYQHTPEELSLSTIGLQCLLIKNLRAASGIVYDNSWLCDPKKQAEFYTVSAELLNDCENDVDGRGPIDYGVAREPNDYGQKVDVGIANWLIRREDFASRQIFGSAFGIAANTKATAGPKMESRRGLVESKIPKPVGTRASHKTVKSGQKKITRKDSKITAPRLSRCRKYPKNLKLFKNEPKKVCELQNPARKDEESDVFVNCVDGLCSDLENMKERPQKRKRAAKNASTKPTPVSQPRASKKKFNDSDFAIPYRTVSKITHEKTKITANNDSTSLNSNQRNSVKIKTEILPELDLKNTNPPKNPSSTQNMKTVAKKNPSTPKNLEKVAKKNPSSTQNVEIVCNENSTNANYFSMEKKIQETKIVVDDNQNNLTCTENSMAQDSSDTFTFPWYPPDMNDCSILVLDPEAQQLVWTSVAIVDEQNKIHEQNSRESVPKSTSADLRTTEISANPTIISSPRTNEISEKSFLQSDQTVTPKKDERTKLSARSVLRPRRLATSEKSFPNN